jgi:hypothetical protein
MLWLALDGYWHRMRIKEVDLDSGRTEGFTRGELTLHGGMARRNPCRVVAVVSCCQYWIILFALVEWHWRPVETKTEFWTN